MPKFYDKVDVLKKPGWLKIRLHRTPEYAEVQQIVRKHALHTICSSGMCPNKAECWSRRTATFMILGDICTRGCRFCATRTGHPLAPDAEEPRRVAESVSLMKLRYVVVTSVTRDDLPDAAPHIGPKPSAPSANRIPTPQLSSLFPISTHGPTSWTRSSRRSPI